MREQVKVKFIEVSGAEFNTWALPGKNIWEIMEMAGWDTGGSCGGRGKCGKCKLRIEGDVSPLSPIEKECLLLEEIKNGLRLACYCIAKGDLTIYLDYLPIDNKGKNNLLRYRRISPQQEHIKTKMFFISGMQKESPQPIYDRIKDALSSYRLELDTENINDLVKIDRPGRPTIELHAIIFDERIVKKVGRHKESLYGLAIDLGSTSLFCALLDLETGETAAMASQNNMQRIYGDDIISRISYCMEHPDGAEILHRILINNLNSMVDGLIDEVGSTSGNIYRVMVVGNPVMLHFLLDIDTSGFREAPYTGIFSEEIQFQAVKIGLNVSPFAQLIVLPQIGGFVGADTTACLLTLAKSQKETYLLIDIGTNGEIVLNHNGTMWAASAAAGPAFEGGRISCGMRAGNGAIEKVVFENGKTEYGIIGAIPARGICGSGIVDLLAVLIKSGCIDDNGNIINENPSSFLIRYGEHGPAVVLFPEQTNGQSALLFQQDDIRQVQLAKSAIRTAIDILLKQANISYQKIDKIYLAGVFGSYLNPRSLQDIGLIPKVDLQKIVNIGNAAAEGAIMALLSNDIYRRAKIIKDQVNYVDLTQHQEFQERFLQNINLPHDFSDSGS